MGDASILRVAIDAPLSRLFDYQAPAETDGSLEVGARVRVPFGRQSKTAIIVELADATDVPADKLRQAEKALDPAPLLAAEDLWLLRFASNYYHHPIGEVVAAALPSLLRQGRPLNETVERIELTAGGMAVGLEPLRRRAPKQAAVLAALARGALTADLLDEEVPEWRRTRKRLLENGWIEITQVTTTPAPAEIGEPVSGPELNADQAAAIDAIEDHVGFNVSLLDGVTGSGKTEVYLRVIRNVLDAGLQVLVLVPEIGLTPQLVRRLGARLGSTPIVLHSALTDSERLQAWRAARCGAASVILGTRSAVFTPIPNLGLVVIDEEHDASLKQQEGFRYSARDLAIVRAKHKDVPVILGSATPSLESLKRCEDDAYLYLRLPVRAAHVAPPLLRIVDLNRFGDDDGLSDPAVRAIKKTINNDGQVLVFLNRRGFAPTLICGGCGHMAECNRCDARMTVHIAAGELRCHHCGATRAIDVSCSNCGSNYRPLGQGTERLEDALQKRFPGHAVARIDSDSMRHKGAMDAALAAATKGETRIMVGTQMLSKGHHFPNLALVVVVNADQGLFGTDFRSGEKLAQSLVQVAGRAGRERQQGEVLIQTAFPEHPFWGELLRGGYEKIAKATLEERRRAAWPPYSRLALIRASAHQREDARRMLDECANYLAEAGHDDLRVLGPVSAPMERRAGRYRAQLLLQSLNRQALHEVLARLRPYLEADRGARKVRWSIDVDPIELF